ncbi:MAG: hypothetical protein A4E32_00244 [Methanomassiliicoccales archaeon PtaU1.Bin124]|nr:MAG: hypothetical protein A4E32_00244 [Methanomassiliicoccales archaeon PtaU1.Bin124]
MVTKQGKPKATEEKKEVRVTKATPIKVVKRDLPLRDIGLKVLAQFYMGETDLEMAKRRAKRYENRDLSDMEAVLSLLSTLIQNADDPQMKAKLMAAVGEYQSVCGLDPNMALGEMHRMELRIFKELGFEAVTPACKKYDGVKLTIEEALSAMPLPHPACTKRLHSKATPLCRCRYYGEYMG